MRLQSGNGLSKAANAGRAPLHEHPGDCYDTPACAVHALLEVEKLPHRIWEPACGKGNIVKVLRKLGHDVSASDISRRGCPNSMRFDFLALGLPGTRVEPGEPLRCIVTNPPYALAQAFVEQALRQVPLVIMLLRLAFLESERRSHLLDTGKLARVHVFSNRLPMMHRAGWQGRRASSAIAFAWFVWDQNHKGPATIDRIRWKPEETGKQPKRRPS